MISDSAKTSAPPARILIIEDDRTLNDQLAQLLQNQGHQICQCHDGQQGLLQAIKQTFDLILLDVLLPTLDGFNALLRLRQSRATPVIIISACNAEEERIQGLQKGADDYLPKPFNFTELLLRIDALLRRSSPMSQRQAQQSRLQCDALILERRQQVAHYERQELNLTALQFRLLWTLLEYKGEALSKPFLYRRVLEKEYSRFDRSLDMHLSRIRRKLEDAGMPPDRLVTVHGKGYRFS